MSPLCACPLARQLAALLVLGAGAWAADAPQAGYQFVKDHVQLYAYDLNQVVDWQSAGDTLSYSSSVSWRFSLTPVVVTSERCELSIVILHVLATQSGPGGSHAVDSSQPVDRNGHEDLLLGHLLALDGALLTVVVDPRSGAVSAVRGGEEVVKRINQRYPARDDGEAPPLAASSAVAYGSDSLSRLWSDLLALPSGTVAPQQITLGGPLPGTIERRWQGSQYSLGLPAGTTHLDGILMADPTPLTASLSDLTGGGSVVMAQGLPGTRQGDLRFTLTLNALTQPVIQHHHLTWIMRQLSR